MMISPSCFENDWFLLNRHKLGDGKFILKFLIIPISLIRSASYTLSRNFDLYPFAYETLIFAVTALILLIGMGIAWRKYPKPSSIHSVDDPYFIRHELKLVFLCSLLMLGIITVLLALYFIFDFPFAWIRVAAQYALCLWMVMMIVYPKKRIFDDHRKITTHLMNQLSSEMEPQLTRRPTLLDIQSDVRKTWQQTISTKAGFERFARFLALQFSLEVTH